MTKGDWAVSTTFRSSKLLPRGLPLPIRNQQAIDLVIARALSQRGVPFAYGGGTTSGPTLGNPARNGTPAPAAPPPGVIPVDDTTAAIPIAGLPGAAPALTLPEPPPPQVVGFDASGLMVYAFAGTGLNWFFPWVTGETREAAANDLQQTLILMAPLILTALAVAFAFRCGLFNIGGQGQYWVGFSAALFVGALGTGMYLCTFAYSLRWLLYSDQGWKLRQKIDWKILTPTLAMCTLTCTHIALAAVLTVEWTTNAVNHVPTSNKVAWPATVMVRHTTYFSLFYLTSFVPVRRRQLYCPHR